MLASSTLLFNNAVTLETDKVNPIPERKVALGAGRCVRQTRLETIFNSEESIRHKVEKIVQEMWPDKETIDNMFLKVPKERMSTGIKFPSEASVGITNALNELQRMNLDKTISFQLRRIDSKKRLSEEEIGVKKEEIKTAIIFEYTDLRERDVRNHLSHIFDDRRAALKRKVEPTEPDQNEPPKKIVAALDQAGPSKSDL